MATQYDSSGNPSSTSSGSGIGSQAGSLIGAYYGGPWGAAAGGLVGGAADQYFDSKTVNKNTSGINLSQQGFDKIIYDILSADQGLANLAVGENMSGGYGSTTKTFLAQDFVTKAAGELAALTAPKQSESSKKSVICTELHRQGKLSPEVYLAGKPKFDNLNPYIVRGYHAWAIPIAIKMQTSEALSNFLAPIVSARYAHIVSNNYNLTGALTVWLGHPVCYCIGILASLVETFLEKLNAVTSN